MDWAFSEIVRGKRDCKQGDCSNNVRRHGEQIGPDGWISEAGNNLWQKIVDTGQRDAKS